MQNRPHRGRLLLRARLEHVPHAQRLVAPLLADEWGPWQVVSVAPQPLVTSRRGAWTHSRYPVDVAELTRRAPGPNRRTPLRQHCRMALLFADESCEQWRMGERGLNWWEELAEILPELQRAVTGCRMWVVACAGQGPDLAGYGLAGRIRLLEVR